jgi:hypothetical protein
MMTLKSRSIATVLVCRVLGWTPHIWGRGAATFLVLGFTYDETRDAFIPPQPYASWVLDEATCLWVAPIPMPDGDYVWDEDAGDWVAADV